MKTRSTLTYFSILCLVFFTAIHSIYAQDQPSVGKATVAKQPYEPSNAFLISPIYTAQWPMGNMADRFGFNNLFGLQLMYKMKKNWIIGVEGSFLFGTKLRENYVIDNITTSSGQLIGQQNELVGVKSQEFGCNVKFNVGKIIPFSHKYPDAGLLLLTGIGFLQHKIGLNVREDVLPQLDKTYRKGYDRMSNGPVISQFIGGVFMARKKFISAYAGLQFDMGFTENRRAYDFYLQRKLSEKRLDMFIGIRVGWILPIFLQASEKEYYYY